MPIFHLGILQDKWVAIGTKMPGEFPTDLAKLVQQKALAGRDSSYKQYGIPVEDRSFASVLLLVSQVALDQGNGNYGLYVPRCCAFGPRCYPHRVVASGCVPSNHSFSIGLLLCLDQARNGVSCSPDYGGWSGFCGGREAADRGLKTVISIRSRGGGKVRRR